MSLKRQENRKLRSYAVVLLFGVAALGCGNLTPSIRKTNQEDRDRAHQEIERVKKEEAERAKKKTLSSIVPVKIEFELKKDSGSDAENDEIQILEDLPLSLAEKKQLANVGDAVVISLEKKLPETYSATLKILVESAESLKQLKEAEIQASFETIRDPNARHALKLKKTNSLDAEARELLIEAEQSLILVRPKKI